MINDNNSSQRNARRWAVPFAVGALAMGFCAGGAMARVSRFDRKVAASIKKGVGFLLRRERHGRWADNITAGPGPIVFNKGETCLVMDALLSVSQSTNDTRLALSAGPMKQGIAQLLRIHPTNTYTAAFQATAAALLPLKPPVLRVLGADLKYLMDSVHRNGAYTYAWKRKDGINPKPGHWDNSNTQYGVLGMWAIKDTGKFNVPRGYWARLARHFRSTQQPDGAWFYEMLKRNPHWAQHLNTMPQAGLASMYLADEYLDNSVRLVPFPDKTIKRALTFVIGHFNPHNNLYGLYGDERVGLYSGLKFFGKTNWYKAAGAAIMRNQQGNGEFGNHFFHASGVVRTAYGLLFLARGGVPVVFNKLQYKGPWDARPRDDANVTEWLSKTYETPLKWQVVNTKVSYQSWLDAPILLITGHAGNGFNGFDGATIAKLRKFIDAGGMVFSTSDGGLPQWNLLMKRAAEQIVHKKYPWKTLAKSNLLYHMQSLPLTHGRLQGVSNGVRLLWVNSPVDLGAVWQRDNVHIIPAWRTAANLFFYATSKSSFARKFPDLHVPRGKKTIRNLNVVQIRYKGNWNPEPGAWPRMAKLEAWKAQTAVKLSTNKISGLNAGQTPLAVITGTAALSVSAAQRKALRDYMNSGGLLFADSAGGKAAFTDSFLTLARQLYPSHALQHVPPDSSLYTGKNAGGANALPVRYRKFFTITNGLHPKPRLLGVKVKGKWVLIFSQDDVTSGYLGTHQWGNVGYAPKSAQALGRNIIAYKLAHH